MRKHDQWPRRLIGAILLSLGMLACAINAFAGDDADWTAVLVPDGTVLAPGTVFTQTWTLRNTGTTTWTPGNSGYTLVLLGVDSLGAVPFTANYNATNYTPFATINSGFPVPPGGQATFSMSFIAPRTVITNGDLFQMCNANGEPFGPIVHVLISVTQGSPFFQYDRSKAVSYANNYAGSVVSDDYFWIDGSTYESFGTGTAAPTGLTNEADGIGDDCAHFLSSCLGSPPNGSGGGFFIPSRVPPTYGEPGVAKLVNNVLIGQNYATEVFNINQLEPGDMIAWNWEGDTNIADLDHATIYLGNGLLASHSASALDVSPSFFQDALPDWVWHLIHISDRPMISIQRVSLHLLITWTEINSAGGAQASTPFYGVQVAFPNSPLFPADPIFPGSPLAWTNLNSYVRPYGNTFMARDDIGTGPMFYRGSRAVPANFIPGPSTLYASNITTTCATIYATDIPVGSNTMYWFQYGTDTNYTNGVSVTNSLATSTNLTTVSARINGLTPATLYHFQVEVTDDWGTPQLGGDQTFTTAGTGSPPTEVTSPATAVTDVNAELNGSVNPNGADTTWWFEYGYDTNYSIANTASAVVSASNTNAVAVNILAGGLNAQTTYHFQLVASNSAGVSYGGDQSFTTPGPPPTLVTLAASSITTTTATLNGTVNGNGSGIAGYFQYDVGSGGSTYSYSTMGNQFYTSGNYNTPQEFSTTISNLTPGTTYHYRIIAYNCCAEGEGVDTNFTTSSGSPPTIVSEGVSGVTNGTALVEGYVNPNGLNTTVYFQYGPYYAVNGTNYPDTGGSNNIAATAQTVYFSFNGVDTSTPYDFRVVAVNSQGTTYGTNVIVSAP